MLPVDVVILCGGQGTRIRPLFPSVPKVLIPVHGKPYLAHCLEWLSKQGIRRTILALGYKAEMVIEYLKTQDFGMEVVANIEKESLGTAGALYNALPLIQTDTVLVMNGDTFPRVEIRRLLDEHNKRGKYKFITVAFNNAGVSAGIYLFEKKAIKSSAGLRSLEQDVFPYKYLAYVYGVDFIDIGTPESYFETREQPLW